MSKLDKKSKTQIKKPDQTTSPKLKLNTNHDIKVICDYCDGPVLGRPSVLKFAQFERFFCCNSCKTLYKEKYAGRIKSLSSTEEN